MTTERPEIIVEGSDDGVTWRPYVFRWKPGAVDRRPRFCTPHMPRLDWQMWFAALAGDCRRQPWFLAFERGCSKARPPCWGCSATTRSPAGRRDPSAPGVRPTTQFTRPGPCAWWRPTSELGPYCPAVGLPTDGAADDR